MSDSAVRLVHLNLTDEDIIRECRSCNDPLVEDLCRRLTNALDKAEAAEAELSRMDHSVCAFDGSLMTDDECDEIAGAILKAAGSALRHHTMPKTHDDIRAAVRASVGEVIDAYEF